MKNITVAFDGKRAVRNTTGLGNYSRWALEALARYGADSVGSMLVLGAGARGSERLGPLLERFPVLHATEPDKAYGTAVSHFANALGLKGLSASMWRSNGLDAQAVAMGADVLHGLSNELPLSFLRSGIPGVVTMHDIIWRRFPSDYKAADRLIYDRKYGWSAQNAHHVIAISECTRRDLITDFHVPEERISVIYQGVDPAFRPVSAATIADVRKRYRLPARYIICVGTVQGRKNQLLAVKALRGLPTDVKLVIVGRRTDYARELDAYIGRHGLVERVVWLSGIPFADLPALYCGALVGVYPSRYEGFGLPVVESIACGTPVVAATGSCLEEAGGAGAVYVNPDDEEECAHELNRLIDSAELRAQMVDAGKRHISSLTQENFARRTIEVYRKVLG